MASPIELPNNSVTLDKDDVIIVVTARGTETREAVADVGEKIRQYAADLRAKSAKVLVVIDARTEKIENSTKEGRAEFRRLASKLDVDAYAFVGDERLQTVMKYVSRGFSAKVPIQFFSSVNQAKGWLLTFENVAPLRPRIPALIMRAVAFVIFAMIAVGIMLLINR